MIVPHAGKGLIVVGFLLVGVAIWFVQLVMEAL